MAISIDSRSIQPGDIFIPVKGERFDGHDFIEDVLAKGAYVLDATLADYAASLRKQVHLPVIGITGSSGKTTTKDRLAALLSTRYRTLSTAENQNNEVGVPLTILKFNQEYKVPRLVDIPVSPGHKGELIAGSDIVPVSAGYEAVVVEMGMRGAGEIKALAEIVQPTHVIITNIGVAHIGRLGSRERIQEAKCEILIPTPYAQMAFLNTRDEGYREVKMIAELNGWCVVPFEEDPLPALARAFDIPASALEALPTAYSPHRMQVLKKNRITIIDDTYNANPDSMRWALNRLREYPGRKIAVLGDMMELGEAEIFFHQSVNTEGIDEILTFGPLFTQARTDHAHAFLDKDALLHQLKKILRQEDVVLVKGSRGMAMEEVVDAL